MGKGVNGNLIPPKKGEVRNPNGKPKGTRNLSTIIKGLLEEGELDWDKVPLKGSADMKQKYGNQGWEAIMYVAIAQAMSGNIKAMEFLHRAQYGGTDSLVTLQFNNVASGQREQYGFD